MKTRRPRAARPRTSASAGYTSLVMMNVGWRWKS